MEDEGFFVLRARRWKIGKFFVLQKKKSYPALLPSDLRPNIRGRRSKKGEFFDLRLRRSKIEDKGFFDLRPRRSKMERLRSSAPKNEEIRIIRRTAPFLEEPPPFSKNPPSFFVLRVRRSKNPPSSIFRAEDWVEDRRGPRDDANSLYICTYNDSYRRCSLPKNVYTPNIRRHTFQLQRTKSIDVVRMNSSSKHCWFPN